jgi:hypothetical protein
MTGHTARPDHTPGFISARPKKRRRKLRNLKEETNGEPPATTENLKDLVLSARYEQQARSHT